MGRKPLHGSRPDTSRPRGPGSVGAPAIPRKEKNAEGPGLALARIKTGVTAPPLRSECRRWTE